jgi:glycosyltransferase involved in cell wall biosynthesis
MRVGIVTPAWNVAPWIGDAIRSVLAQSHTDWRMVVVDDGSTDATASLAAGFVDVRLRLLRQENAGVSVARNRGLAALEPGVEAVLCLDADDWLAPDALTRLVAALGAAPGAVAASGPCSILGRVLRPPGGDILRPLLWRNHFANLGHVLIRRAAAIAAGPHIPGLAYGEDWDYLIRLALVGRFTVASGRMPVLYVRVRTCGAVHRLGADPAAFRACLDAIFANPMLRARLGPAALLELRRLADAESHWIIGRELIRHARRREGRAWLLRSVRAHPSGRRLLLLAAAHALPLLPARLRGPFEPYPPGWDRHDGVVDGEMLSVGQVHRRVRRWRGGKRMR